jgi:hypothetical protein
VVFQSVIQMSYADKLLTEVNLRFRDLYKNVLGSEVLFSEGPKVFKSFSQEFLGFANTFSYLIRPPFQNSRTFERGIGEC